MTMRSRYPMACSCGHKGALLLRENDQPYSKMWESYSLEGFDGGSYRVDGFADLSTVMAAIAPKCPKCGSGITSLNFISE